MVTEPLADELGVGLAVAPVRAVARLVLGTVAGDVVLGVAMIKFLSCHKSRVVTNENKKAILKSLETAKLSSRSSYSRKREEQVQAAVR